MTNYIVVEFFDIPVPITIRRWDTEEGSRYDWTSRNDESDELFESATLAKRDAEDRFE